MWALAAGSAGAGGLMYCHNFYRRSSHAHAEPCTGPGYTQDYKGAAAPPPEAAAVPLPTITLPPPFKATDVAKGTTFTPDDLENTAVVLVFVDPTSPAALDGLGRLQDVSAEAGRSSKVPLQPLELDMTPGEPAESNKLAQPLTALKSREKGRADPEMAPIRGLVGENAANKIKDSVQRLAGSPAAGGAAVMPDVVTEEGVLHLFGPDGMLVIQYDATLLLQEGAKNHWNGHNGSQLSAV
ncbi:g7620 [Coccomyxa viridis]|uniref:G7620 protein n=1 Tax=Coccomyxa viridis TaxID=1274662 RepID=A0ABP1G4Y0_9CHLO